MKLSEIIKEIEEKQGIDEFYLHRNYDNGKLELNIEFVNNIADVILERSSIKEINSCAYWE
jgi:hypothetical protein